MFSIVAVEGDGALERGAVPGAQIGQEALPRATFGVGQLPGEVEGFELDRCGQRHSGRATFDVSQPARDHFGEALGGEGHLDGRGGGVTVGARDGAGGADLGEGPAGCAAHHAVFASPVERGECDAHGRVILCEERGPAGFGELDSPAVDTYIPACRRLPGARELVVLRLELLGGEGPVVLVGLSVASRAESVQHLVLGESAHPHRDVRRDVEHAHFVGHRTRTSFARPPIGRAVPQLPLRAVVSLALPQEAFAGAGTAKYPG